MAVTLGRSRIIGLWGQYDAIASQDDCQGLTCCFFLQPSAIVGASQVTLAATAYGGQGAHPRPIFNIIRRLRCRRASKPFSFLAWWLLSLLALSKKSLHRSSSKSPFRTSSNRVRDWAKGFFAPEPSCSAPTFHPSCHWGDSPEPGTAANKPTSLLPFLRRDPWLRSPKPSSPSASLLSSLPAPSRKSPTSSWLKKSPSSPSSKVSRGWALGPARTPASAHRLGTVRPC